MRRLAELGGSRGLERLAELNIVLFVLATYVLETDAGSAYFRAAQVVLVVSAAMLVLHRGRLVSGPLLPWAAMLFVLSSLPMLISQSAIAPEFRTFFVNCVLAVAFLQLLTDRRRILLALSSIGIAGLLAAISVIVQLDLGTVSATSVTQSWSLRLGANLPGGNPNIAGMYLAIAFGAALSRALAPSMRTAFRIAWLACAGVTALAVSLTGSRKAIIYCVVAAVILIVYINRRLMPVLLGVGLVGAWALFNVPWLYAIVGRRLLGQGDVGESDALRAHAVPAALNAFYGAPQGTGWGSSERFLTGLGYTHINYLEVLVSVGLFGLLVYYSIHVLVLSGIRRIDPVIRPAIAALVVAGLTLDVFQVTYLYKAPTLVLTICVAALCSARERRLPREFDPRVAELPRARRAGPASAPPGAAKSDLAEVR